MLRQSVLKRHADLMDTMASHVGVDLEEEILRGRLDAGDVSDMVLRCASCANPGDCADRLANPDTQISLPSYCRNAELLEKLGTGS